MTISDLYDYLHLKQRILSRALLHATGKDRRLVSDSLKKLHNLESSLDFLCESVYYFQLGNNED